MPHNIELLVNFKDNMATIHIKRQHQLDQAKVRKEVQSLADKLADELSVDCKWEGDRLVFKRTGAHGYINLGESEVELEIKLGMVLSPLKGKIEKTVSSYLDERLV